VRGPACTRKKKKKREKKLDEEVTVWFLVEKPPLHQTRGEGICRKGNARNWTRKARQDQRRDLACVQKKKKKEGESLRGRKEEFIARLRRG